MTAMTGGKPVELDTLPPLALNAWLRWDIVARLLPKHGTTVLEIGCGQGSVGARLARRYDSYLGLEPDSQSAAVARSRLDEVGNGEVSELMSTDLEPGRTFDLVCAFEVIEHIEDDDKALAEWAALVAPGGSLLISTPADQDRFGPFDTIVGHYRRYEPAALAEQLRAAGLVDVRVLRYGAPLGYALEQARQLVGRRRLGRSTVAATTAEELTAGSGRVLQPTGRAMALGVRAASYPFRVVQRRVLPDRGLGLVAIGRKPR